MALKGLVLSVAVYIFFGIIRADKLSSDKQNVLRYKPFCNASIELCVTDVPLPQPSSTHRIHDETEIKYGLVPAFLIGASLVIVIYIISHCLYLHCYATHKMKSMASEHARYCQASMHTDNPTILLNDCTTHHHGNNLQHVTSVVKYDGGYGTTELQATPLIFYKSENEVDTKSPSAQRFYMLTQSPRASVSSADFAPGDSLEPGTAPDGDARKTSICFVPIGQMSSQDNQSEWQPLNSYIYSAILIAEGKESKSPTEQAVEKGPAIPKTASMSTAEGVIVATAPPEETPGRELPYGIFPKTQVTKSSPVHVDVMAPDNEAGPTHNATNGDSDLQSPHNDASSGNIESNNMNNVAADNVANNIRQDINNGSSAQVMCEVQVQVHGTVAN